MKSIAATGADQVTITLKQPDYWLPGELASMGGVIIEQAFAEKQGKNYGTPAGSIMCTGAYQLKSWTPGVGVTAVVNTNYWDHSVHPMVQQIVHQGRARPHQPHLRHADRGHPGFLLLRPVHAQPAAEEQERQGLPGAGLGDRRVRRLRRPRARSPTSRCARRCRSRSTASRSSARCTTARR